MYKILIVEDDEVIAKTLKVHLEKWGYEAVCVQDFNHVMECFVKEQPSIVLMTSDCRFLTDTTGVHRYGISRRCR